MSNEKGHAEGVIEIKSLSELPNNINVVVFVFLPGCSACISMSPFISDENKKLKTVGRNCVIRQCNYNKAEEGSLFRKQSGFPTIMFFNKTKRDEPIEIMQGFSPINKQFIIDWIKNCGAREGFHGDYDNIEQAPRKSSVYARQSFSQQGQKGQQLPVALVPRQSISSSRKSINQLCNQCVKNTCNKLKTM
jgi:hypothetical protein